MTEVSSKIATRNVQRQEAYLPGTGLDVWEVAWVARAYGGDIAQTARHLGIDCSLVEAALAYAAEHRMDIETEIHDHVAWTWEDFHRLVPQAELVQVDIDSPDPAS